MTNLILFLNSFLSYLLVVAVFVLVIGVAVFIGIKMRQNKDAEIKTEEASAVQNRKTEE